MQLEGYSTSFSRYDTGISSKDPEIRRVHVIWDEMAAKRTGGRGQVFFYVGWTRGTLECDYDRENWQLVNRLTG